MNTTFYSDIAPEFHLHMHSIWVKTSKQGWFLLTVFFFGIIAPCWAVAIKCHMNMGSHLFPAVRPGPDHAHMAPAILGHLKENDYEKKPDRFGRRNAEFYKNHLKQEMSSEYQPKLVKKFNWLGFNF